jgi:hypothetical protein
MVGTALVTAVPIHRLGVTAISISSMHWIPVLTGLRKPTKAQVEAAMY